jgi:energy-coupling factor transport system substrate-specific component
LLGFASALFGAPWGLLTIVYGLMQGGAAELVFAMGLYRRWGLPTALLAGAAAGAAAVLLDLVLYYPSWAAGFQVLYAALVIPSAAIVAGLGGWLLVRALTSTGVLGAFPAGREQPEV